MAEVKIGRVFTLEDARKQWHPGAPYRRDLKVPQPMRIVSEKENWEVLKGFVDTHCHGAPEGWRPERPTMLETCMEASKAGLKAIVFKDHNTLTSDRAWIVQECLDKWAAESGITPVQVYGSVTLNYAVGGLNPEAVKAALSCDFGKFTKIIWMPSISSAWQWKNMGRKGGISILRNGKLKPVVKEIIQIVAGAPTKVAIASSHISVRETMALADAGAAAGVDVIATHASQELTVLTLEEAKELIKRGAWIELCQVSVLGTPLLGARLGLNWQHSFRLLQELGPSRIILSTDAGQPGNPPVWAASVFIRHLLTFGVSQEDVNLMAKANPAKVIGIG